MSGADNKARNALRSPSWSASNAVREGEHTRLADAPGATIARKLNGPLTALLLYVSELKQHSQRLVNREGDSEYLQKILDNAVQQTERVCALVQEISGADVGQQAASPEPQDRARGRHRTSGAATEAGRRPLTRREREVLNLISEGYSNKQGALRMQISPRTFESHRAEAMRKLGARNTADLVRAALLHAID